MSIVPDYRSGKIDLLAEPLTELEVKTLTPSRSAGTAACRICQHSEHRSGARLKSSPCYNAAEYRMYRCEGCRSAFVSPTPSDATLARFYGLYHLADEQGGVYDQVEERMQSDFPAKLNLVRQAAGRQPGRALVVGCGKGYFVECCRDSGVDATGCDLSESGVRFATEQLKVPAFCGLLSEIKQDIGLYDTATFWATIEHVPDPVATLRDIASVLRPGGRLLLDTGIGDDWLDNMLPGRNQWYDPPQHLWVFSAAGLVKAVEAAGFTVVEHDHNFERSMARRLAKTVRNGALAAGLRAAAVVGRMGQSPFGVTRYPIGNLQSIVARVNK